MGRTNKPGGSLLEMKKSLTHSEKKSDSPPPPGRAVFRENFRQFFSLTGFKKRRKNFYTKLRGSKNHMHSSLATRIKSVGNKVSWLKCSNRLGSKATHRRRVLLQQGHPSRVALLSLSTSQTSHALCIQNRKVQERK